MTQTTAQLTGANVRAEMARRGITQTQLAQRLGISQTAMSMRLRGKTAFDVDELAAVAAVLDIDPRALLLAESA